MNTFERIEEQRELTAGLEYEKYHERISEDDEDAYDGIRDPRHPDHYETLVDIVERDEAA